jgi:hypothetical protein
LDVVGKIGVVAVAALALAGCGSSSSHSSGQTVSLTRAAYISGGAQGTKVLMSMQETIPGAGAVTMTANGAFSNAPREGAMTMHMTIPSAAATQAGLGSLNVQAVLVPGTVYMKMPPQIAAKIPGGKPWWRINLNQAAKLAGIPGLSSLMSSTSSLNDPGQYLDFLRATSNGSVKNLGPATVNGSQTTHYRARIDLAKLPNAVPAARRAAVQQLVATLRQRGLTPSGFPVDAWIDSSNLIRQMQMAYAQPLPGGQSANVAMKMDYLAYGPQPKPTAPPQGQTLDLLALLKQVQSSG